MSELVRPNVTKRKLNELSRKERVKIAKNSFGMWADREDLGDTVDYVAALRHDLTDYDEVIVRFNADGAEQ